MILIHWRRQRLIDDYLAGGLSAKQRTALENHVAHCAECRQLMEKEKEFIKQVAEAGEFLDQAMERMTARAMQYTPYSESQTDPLPPSLTQEEEFKGVVRPVWTQRWVWVTAVVAIIVLNGLLWLYYRPSQLPANQIVQVLGDGLWIQPPGSSQWIKYQNRGPAPVPITLKPGDTIKTDNYTQFSLKIGNVAQGWFHPSSLVTIMENASTAFTLQRGETFVSVSHLHKPFRVMTPAGLVEVLGTEFQLAVDSSQRTEVSCIQDAVYFQNSKGKVVLQQGYQSSAQSTTAPGSPMPVDTRQYTEWQKQTEHLLMLSPNERVKAYAEFITRANQFYHNQQYADALENYRLAASLDPDSYSSYYGVGRAYRTMGEYALATAAYLRALQKNPDDAVSSLQLAQSLIELKQYSQAENVLHAQIERRPNEHANWVALGNAYLLFGDLSSAQQAYQRAIQLGADTCVICNPEVYGGLAEIARRKNDLHSAQTALSKIYSSSTIPGLVYAEQAWLYHDLGNLSQESTAWNNYLQTDPKGAFADYAKKHLFQRVSSN